MIGEYTHAVLCIERNVVMAPPFKSTIRTGSKHRLSLKERHSEEHGSSGQVAGRRPTRSRFQLWPVIEIVSAGYVISELQVRLSIYLENGFGRLETTCYELVAKKNTVVQPSMKPDFRLWVVYPQAHFYLVERRLVALFMGRLA